MKFGTNEIQKVYLGTTELDKLYFGTNEAYEKPASFDQYTLAVYHFNGDNANAVTTSTYTNSFISTSTYFQGTGKFDKCFQTSSNLSRSVYPFLSGTGTSTNDFTIDFWVCKTAYPGSGSEDDQICAGLFNARTPNGPGVKIYATTSAFKMRYCQGSTYKGDSSTLNLNQWYHWALERYNGTANYYIDGTKVKSFSDTTDLTYQVFGALQRNSDASLYKIDELRISNVARYQGQNFTPPTAPY